jgi:hypothetical protein
MYEVVFMLSGVEFSSTPLSVELANKVIAELARHGINARKRAAA